MVKVRFFSVKDSVMTGVRETFLTMCLSTSLKSGATLDAGMCNSRTISKSIGAVKQKKGGIHHIYITQR